ncbi:MAG: sugar nucleotide-binding protein [Planctomycetota bacterium]|nr:sugar nucleotide-binding protein [Planctomycetota bacterium]
MDKLLIAGVDTVVGANLAAWLGGRYEVTGLSWESSLSIEGCEIELCRSGRDNPAAWLSNGQPDWIVFCGPGAESSWDEEPSLSTRADWQGIAGTWARAAKEWNAEFTLVSSDAVFTGPWMFHRENGSCFCDTPTARLLRNIEQSVIEANPQALIVRTNAFGWSPREDRPGLAERIVETLANGQELRLDCLRHATPILATDLADVLDEARQQKLAGIYHVGGGERINPFRFACLLADQFGLSLSGLEACDTTLGERRDYGAGETSLQSRRIRKTLEVALPLIREGIARLHEQHVSGYRDRFSGETSSLMETSRAA